MLAERLSKIDEPQTIRMSKLSRELRSQGQDIIDLSLGEPDFKTPQHIIEAAKQAMDDGFTKYPPVAGFPELRQAIAEKFKRENALHYAPDQVMVCTGAKQCIANAVLSVVNEHDEVIIPSPFWVTYADIVKLRRLNLKLLSHPQQNASSSLRLAIPQVPFIRKKNSLI